jgi:hypothetical protein
MAPDISRGMRVGSLSWCAVGGPRANNQPAGYPARLALSLVVLHVEVRRPQVRDHLYQ